MILQIDPSSSVPIYQQIVELVIYRIASGELADGDQLPSIRMLSESLRINPNTVIKAYRDLEHLRYAESRHGKGYFIAEGSAAVIRTRWLESSLEDLRVAIRRALAVGVSPEDIRNTAEATLSKGGSK